MLTLEERERIAYANGDVQLARLLAEASDCEAEVSEEQLQDAYNRGYDEGFADGEDSAGD